MEVVDLLQAGDLLGLALLDLDRALDQADVAGAGIALRAVHDASVGPDDVVGRHLAAVVEVGVVAQRVGVDEAVARHLHVLGELEHRLVAGGVPVVERAMDDVGVDVVLGARRGVDVEAVEARAIGRGDAQRAALAWGLGFCHAGHDECERRCGDPSFHAFASCRVKLEWAR